MRYHGKLFVIGQGNAYVFKHGAANGVFRDARCNRVKAHGRKYYESRHTAAVFIAGNTEDVILKPGVQQEADTLLCFPGSAGKVIQVRDVKTGLVPHGVLAYQAGGIRELTPESVARHIQRLTEQLVQSFFKSLLTAHQANETGNILLHLPQVSPAVVFIIIITSAYTAVIFYIDIDPVAVAIFRHKELFVGIPDIPVILGSRRKQLLIVFFMKIAGQLRQCPVVVTAAQRYRHGLSFLERMHFGHGFLLAYT